MAVTPPHQKFKSPTTSIEEINGRVSTDWTILQGRSRTRTCIYDPHVIPSAFAGVQATRVGETFSCSTAELPCRRVAGAGLEPATTSVRSCSSSGICPQTAQTPTKVQEMFYILYPAELPTGKPAGRDSNPRPCNSLRIWRIAEIRYKLQATCTNPIARSEPTA